MKNGLKSGIIANMYIVGFIYKNILVDASFVNEKEKKVSIWTEFNGRQNNTHSKNQ